ncbi:hypothetical protein F4680DRAFT_102519 [Xylaria scruposa]|nr:hypothetical protein F4680DRAFT_102519 [Xylaria scruposa]
MWAGYRSLLFLLPLGFWPRIGNLLACMHQERKRACFLLFFCQRISGVFFMPVERAHDTDSIRKVLLLEYGMSSIPLHNNFLPGEKKRGD